MTKTAKRTCGETARRVIIVLICVIYALLAHTAEAQTVSGHLIKITFNNTVDNERMQLGNTYHNQFSEEYTLRNFKYYISNISLKAMDGKTTLFPEAHLINEADSSSKIVTITAEAGSFTSISFLIGVDSIYNVSGTQTGELDPEKGMFWTWNSGYIVAKLEAISLVSTAPNNNVTYHIGGFKTGQNVSRLIMLQLPGVKQNKTISEMIIEADADKWFSGVHSLKISEHAVCTTPGQLALQYADNYAAMFTIASVK